VEFLSTSCWDVKTHIHSCKVLKVSQDSILISTNQDPQSSRHLMSTFSKDETGHGSAVGTILSFTLYIMNLIPHGDIHSLLGYALILPYSYFFFLSDFENQLSLIVGESQDSILISTNQDPQSSRHLMRPYCQDKTCHASPVGTILSFTLYVMGLILRRDGKDETSHSLWPDIRAWPWHTVCKGPQIQEINSGASRSRHLCHY
jgi:hypothetical protein